MRVPCPAAPPLWNANIFRLRIVLAGLLLLLSAHGAYSGSAIAPFESADGLEECTIAVVHGSATADGRPLLWKNRDSGLIHNEVVWFAGERFAFVAIVTAGELDKAWVGVNEAGFAIMNALSYNLPDICYGGMTNGELMFRALGTCATADDFESLLLQTGETGRENPANLGVIDAKGAAVMFEAGSFSHVRWNATDRYPGPGGFIVRANFSLSADTTQVPTTWRFRRARRLIASTAAQRGITPADLIRCARDLAARDVDPYPLPFQGAMPGYEEFPGYIDTSETINRRSSVSSGIVWGVLPGEDPRLATFLAALGQPVVTPFLPVWAAAGVTPPELDGETTSPLCNLAQARIAECHDVPFQWNLLNTWKLADADRERPRYLRLAERIDRIAWARLGPELSGWRQGGVVPSEMADVQREIAARAFLEYGGGSLPGGTALAPREPLALRMFPNPMRGDEGIAFAWAEAPPRAGGLGIYDAVGREVARVSAPAGIAEASVRWDGRDSRGMPVASGVYFCRPSWEGTRGYSFVVVR